MLEKTGKFFRPHRTTIVIFLALILIMPVFYIGFEPAETNGGLGEEQHWLIKTTYYGSSLEEYLFHTDANLDVFIGLLQRNYFINAIGILLLAIDYFIACGIDNFFHQRRNKSPQAIANLNNQSPLMPDKGQGL